MNITTVGIDLAKNAFSVHGVDGHGKVVFKKTVSRKKMPECPANLPPPVLSSPTQRVAGTMAATVMPYP